jgi:hypothetical protein
VSPSVLVDHLDIYNADYGLWRPVYHQHAYHAITMNRVTGEKQTQERGTRPREADFPKPLDPVDDLPPVTVVTHVTKPAAGKLVVRGTTSDNGTVTHVRVNGHEARALRPNFAEWEVVLEGLRSGECELKAYAEDAAGNVEARPHVLRVSVP